MWRSGSFRSGLDVRGWVGGWLYLSFTLPFGLCRVSLSQLHITMFMYTMHVSCGIVTRDLLCWFCIGGNPS